MIPEYFTKTWLEEYVESLNQFNDDLDLKIAGYKIYLSMDFYDIYNFCFPFSLHSRITENWDDRDYMKYYYDYQISRCTMFFMLNNIYKKPNLLLAPYGLECDNFIEYLNVQVDRYIYKELKKYQKNPNPEMANLIEDCRQSGNYEKLIDYIGNNFPKLIYFYSRGYSSSIEMYHKLLTSFFSDDLRSAFECEEEIQQDLYTILASYDSKHIFYKKIENKVIAARNKIGKYSQNERDAEAIYSVLCLNEIYDKDKKAFCLISSADHLKKIMESPEQNVNIAIVNGRGYRILRNTRFFLDIMFEINNYFNYSMNKVRLEKIDFRDLRLSIMKTISKLAYYNSYLSTAGGVLAEAIQEQARKEINLDFSVERMDSNLSILLDDYIGIEENFRSYKDLDKKIAESIIETYGQDPFSKGLFLRRIEIERKTLNKYINDMRKSKKKNLCTTTFSLPFKLHIINSDADNIIKNIVSANIKGRNEFRRLRETSDHTMDHIITELVKLLDQSNKIDNDEKLLVLQFCFLYIGRFDLVDHIYDLFNKYVESYIMREMAYMYLVSFIRKFRAIKIYHSNLFLNMAKLCDDSIYLSEQKIPKETILYEFHKCGERYILRNKETGEIFISESKEVNTDMIVIPIDIRFFHLKVTIINRFIHDFELIEKEILENLIKEFKLVFIPIVEIFERGFRIAILSGYAYLLSLYTEAPNYKLNLEDALRIMAELREDVNMDPNEKEPLWGYVRNYQYGFILYKYSLKCDDNEKSSFIQRAKHFFELSSQELPTLAKSLHEMINEKIVLCDEQLKALNERKI